MQFIQSRDRVRRPCSDSETLPPRSRGKTPFPQRLLRRPWWAVSLLVLLLTLPAFPAVAASLGPQAAIAKAGTLLHRGENNRNNMREAIHLLQKASRKSQDIRIPLYLAEAYYRMADPSAKIDKSYPLFKKAGMQAKKVVDRDPKRAAGHYWYGLYLLRKAQKVGGVWAYFIVKDGIRELETVRKTEPGYDHGGASRILGLLYYTAPGWSPFGDVDKSIRLEKEAAGLAPNYLLNRLYLARAYQKKGNRDAAVKEYRSILAVSLGASAPREEVLYQKEARKKLTALVRPAKTLAD